MEPQATLAPTAASASNLAICVQASPFNTAEARRFETRVASLDLSARQSRVVTPYQEATSRLVYLPPNGGREGAQRRSAELKERGVENFYIMQGESPLRWAISLGVFTTEARPRNWWISCSARVCAGCRCCRAARRCPLPANAPSGAFFYETA